MSYFDFPSAQTSRAVLLGCTPHRADQLAAARAVFQSSSTSSAGLCCHPTVLGILLAYVYFVLSLGPQLMANRKPLNLKKFMLTTLSAQAGCQLWILYCVW
uniref:Very-long-chain 3-oxoacyl-CoA synthase n=1 Tax=Phasianus colchicus TaxID=9054 RepID=A0A669PGW7_PHACC